MTTATRKIETKNSTIEIKMTREVQDKVNYMDGHQISTGREAVETLEIKITSKRNGRVERSIRKPEVLNPMFYGNYDELTAKGAYARIGNGYISREMYDAITAAISDLDAELGKTDEQIAIEQAEIERKQIADENLARLEAEYIARQNHSGWCNKCHSYCYGDCEA